MLNRRPGFKIMLLQNLHTLFQNIPVEISLNVITNSFHPESSSKLIAIKKEK